MILGLEIRSSVCGWSLLDETAESFVDLGVHDVGFVHLDVTTLSRVAAGHGLAKVLAPRAATCETIVVERWNPELAEVNIGLAWGSVLGVVAMMPTRPRLVTIDPGQWKHEIAFDRDASDRDALAKAVHLLCAHPRAELALCRMYARSRDYGPAVAASMIALTGALRLAKEKR